MEYSAQHNHGKYHLIGDDCIECGNTAALNCTKTEMVIYENNMFYEIHIYANSNSKVPIYEQYYCKKCLKKIRKRGF
jgi:hypothetical protein